MTTTPVVELMTQLSLLDDLPSPGDAASGDLSPGASRSRAAFDRAVQRLRQVEAELARPVRLLEARLAVLETGQSRGLPRTTIGEVLRLGAAQVNRLAGIARMLAAQAPPIRHCALRLGQARLAALLPLGPQQQTSLLEEQVACVRPLPTLALRERVAELIPDAPPGGQRARGPRRHERFRVDHESLVRLAETAEALAGDARGHVQPDGAYVLKLSVLLTFRSRPHVLLHTMSRDNSEPTESSISCA